MKIAFIVMCHKNFEQINRLFEQLKKFDADIFVHIDKKSFTLRKKISEDKKIYILPDERSYDISWGGINMILATLELIKYVKDTSQKYDYIWLLSGQDYIISNPKNIIDYMSKNLGCNYIDIIKRGKKYNRYKKLYEVSYKEWMTRNKFLNKSLKRIYMILTGGFSYTLPLFRRKKTFDFEFEFGSQWWTLTSECAYFLLDYCENNREYINYFKNTIIPDECFFQTLFMNSNFKNNYKSNLTFVNWKNNRRSPETLTSIDYSMLKELSGKYFFARKFDYKVDNKIFDLLDKYVGE